MHAGMMERRRGIVVATSSGMNTGVEERQLLLRGGGEGGISMTSRVAGSIMGIGEVGTIGRMNIGGVPRLLTGGEGGISLISPVSGSMIGIGETGFVDEVTGVEGVSGMNPRGAPR